MARARGTAWRRLLDGSRAIGGAGGYRAGAVDETIGLRTCAWRQHACVALGAQGPRLFEPELPDSYRVSHHDRDWTGRAITYSWRGTSWRGTSWRGGDLRVDLRTTLPGPLLSTAGTTIRIRWPSGGEPQTSERLGAAGGFTFRGLADARGWHGWLAMVPHQPVVVVPSVPVRAVHIISHMHWEVEFATPGGALLLVPLLDAHEAPRTAQQLAPWRELARRPPLSALEDYRMVGNRCMIRARFPGARLAPLPPWLVHCGSLAKRPAAITLLRGWDAPYQVATSSSWIADIDLDWSTAHTTGEAVITAAAGELPDELAYAGDATWEPGTTMDQLLALRSWAPALGSIAGSARPALEKLLAPPTAAQLRADTEALREPHSKLAWTRLRSMWAHNGDACYDADWYNGLALSGLARASACTVPAISGPAQALAAACRPQRAGLVNYFSVFSDWATGTAWSDPRGWMWNADCVHNGLEGILGESRLRQHEGDRQGADDLRALAARTAAGLRAAMAMPAHLAALPTCGLKVGGMVTWSRGADDVATGAIGIQDFVSWRAVQCCTPRTRNPYVLAGHFPEWAALLRAHVDPVIWKNLPFQAEQSDWIAWYLGPDWQQRRARGDQEARVQAATFYHAAPEVCFRAWVLNEPPTVIASRFTIPLGIAERVAISKQLVTDAHPTPKSFASVVLGTTR